MSSNIDRRTRVHVSLDDNSATIEVTKSRGVPELFNDDGELRLWEDDSGWSGYVHDIHENGRFYRVNCLSDGTQMERHPVTEEEVVQAVQDHVEDPQAGGAGQFVRRCSPP